MDRYRKDPGVGTLYPHPAGEWVPVEQVWDLDMRARKLSADFLLLKEEIAAADFPDSEQLAHMHREIYRLHRRLADKIQRNARLSTEADDLRTQLNLAHAQIAARAEVEAELRKAQVGANDAYRADVGAILDALALGDHARPVNPHEVVAGEILPTIAALRLNAHQ